MHTMNKTILPMLLCSCLFVVGCSEERPARTVTEFLDNPQFLEAAVVRCSQNRAESRYEAECVNARQAVSLIEARAERARRERLEAESESKRDALRRTQRAAAAARKHAAEREVLREEAEYLAQFGEVPKPVEESDLRQLEANTPGAVIPSPAQTEQSPALVESQDPPVIFDEPVRAYNESVPASDGGNAPVMNSQQEPEPETDLNSVRDELRRRQEESSN
jgi:hypothetical protein